MTYLDRGIDITVVCVLLAGCTTNPWFHVDSDSGASDSSGTATSSGGQQPTTGEAPTSGDPSAGTGSASGTTGVAESSGSSTGVTPVTTTMGSDPGESTAGPGTDTGTSAGDTDQEGSSSSGGEPCGNGVMDEGEECDDGVNAEDSMCTPECKIATCGDGFVYPDGGEVCDAGPNNPEDSLECTNTCQIPSCGDMIVQSDENCDSGSDNGGGKGFCSADCKAPVMVELEIRVTNGTTLGVLAKNDKQGVAAADELCKTFGLNWKAMISDGMFRVASETGWSNVGQKAWVLLPYTAYVNASPDPGLRLIGVTGKDALLGDPMTGALIHPIGLVQSQVWTGLNDDWTSSEDDCDDWKSGNAQNKGVVGQALDKLDSYLQLDDVEGFCNTPRRLYCVQQPP